MSVLQIQLVPEEPEVLELRLQIVESQYVDPENQTKGLWKISKCS